MRKSDHQKRIEEFMTKAGQTLPDQVEIPSKEVRLLRARLILEEAIETIFGLGFRVEGHEALMLNPVFAPDLEQIVDGCADLSVVTIGTLSMCGIADLPILEEVDAANLRKFEGDAHADEHGKWIKPSDWQPPDIKGRIEEQRRG